MQPLHPDCFKKTLLILNPPAAQDDQLRALVGELREQRFPLSVRVTWESADVQRYIKEAVGEGVEQVILAGGDGTIHEGLVAQQALLATTQRAFALAALPFGTGNDFVRTIYTERALSVPTRELLLKLLSGEQVALDVGVLESEAAFMNAVSIGRGAEVTESTPQAMKELLGQRAYTLWGLLTLGMLTPFHYELCCEGEAPMSGEAWMIVIGNGQFVGGGFRACPQAHLQDGLLDVMIVPRMGPFNTVKAVSMLLAQGKHTEHEQLSYLQTASLELRALEADVQINIDGEHLQGGAVKIRAKQRASSWLVPVSASSPAEPEDESAH